jgi:hypothetical protein
LEETQEERGKIVKDLEKKLREEQQKNEELNYTITDFEFVEEGLRESAKEVIKGKGKRGRKRKSAAVEAEESEADEPEPKPEVACAAKEVINGRGKRGQKRKSVVQEAEEPEPEVARMTDAPVP